MAYAGMKRIKPKKSGVKRFRILVIDNNSPFVLPLIRSFSGVAHIRVDVLLTGGKKRGRFRFSRYLDRLSVTGELLDENVLEVLSDTVARYGSHMVIPTREWISALLYRHKEALEQVVKLHPLPPDTVLDITRNKRKLNDWLAGNGYPFARLGDVQAVWKGEYPVLAKPEEGTGGQGIVKLSNPEELESYRSGIDPADPPCFLQEYIRGYDIDFSCFAIDGKILYHTVQKNLDPGRLVFSKSIAFVRENRLTKQAFSIIARLRFSGIAHLDFRYSEQTGKDILVDFNARYWSTVQGSRAMGINFPYLAAMYTLQGEIKELDYRTGRYYFTSTALKSLFTGGLSGKNKGIRLKDTQLYFLYKDPVPELLFLLSEIRGILLGKRNR